METNNFLHNMAEFTEVSLDWCSDEALKATQTVFDLLQTLQTMDGTLPKTDISQTTNIHDARLTCTDQLNNMAQANSDIQALVSPILQTLQFQDAISQQMAGLTKMLRVWIDVRTQLNEDGSTISDIDFGQQLLQHCISAEEIAPIREHIPDLPEIEADDDDVLF